MRMSGSALQRYLKEAPSIPQRLYAGDLGPTKAIYSNITQESSPDDLMLELDEILRASRKIDR